MKIKKTFMILFLMIALIWQAGNSIPTAKASNWYDNPMGASPSGNLVVQEGESFSASGWFSPHYVDIAQFYPLKNPQDRTRVKIKTTGCVKAEYQYAVVKEKERIYQNHWFSSTSYIAIDQWSDTITATGTGTGTVTQELSINNNVQYPYWSAVSLGGMGTVNVTCRSKKVSVVTGSVTGHVLNNQDKSPLAGWKVALKKEDGTSLFTISDNRGVYNFPNLAFGLYAVSEEVLPNWSKVSSSAPAWSNVLINSNTPIVKDFLNQPNIAPPPIVTHQGLVSGKIKTLTDTPLSGWSVQLTDNAGHTVVTKSDIQGKYSFNNINSGSYTLKQIIPVGWAQVSPTKNSISVKIEDNKTLTQDFINQALIGGNCKQPRGCR